MSTTKSNKSQLFWGTVLVLVSIIFVSADWSQSASGATHPDPIPTIPTLPPPNVNMWVQAVDSPDPVMLFSDLTYKIFVRSVSFPSTLNATGVEVVSFLPSNVEIQSVTSSQGNCQWTTGVSTVTCNLGTMSSMGEAIVSIIVEPTTLGIITNTVQVSANERDLFLANNVTTAATEVIPCAIQNVPLYKQHISPSNDGNPYWENDAYGAPNQCLNSTMSRQGCGTTAAAMLLAQRGVHENFGFLVDPGLLNTWLRSQPDGYKGCSVNWVAVARYARSHGDPTLYYKSTIGRRDDEILNESLCQAKIPVILRVPGHFVLATGSTTSNSINTWTIHDPAYNFGNNRADLSFWGNSYEGLRLFSQQAQSALIVGGSTSIEILVTDPLGRQTGVNPETSTFMEDIPNSSYFVDSIDDDFDPEGSPTPKEKVVEIFEPTDGDYSVKIIGIEDGTYTFHFFGYDTEQNLTGSTIVTGQTSLGVVQTYIASYSSAPGSPFVVQKVIDNVVNMDIKPDDFSNSINLNNKGIIPVAILTTKTFDATTVDPLSVKFGEGKAMESHNRGHIEDSDKDGDNDLMLHFQTQQTGIACGDKTVSITGKTFSGESIVGTDDIKIVGCRNKSVTDVGSNGSAEDVEAENKMFLPVIVND